MNLFTNVRIVDDYYGIDIGPPDKRKFAPKGRLPNLQAIYTVLESEKVYFKLATDYLGKPKLTYIERGSLTEPKLSKELCDLGFDVTRETFDLFVDAIRLQETAPDVPVVPAYSSLGWLQVPKIDESTGEFSVATYFRCSKLIGSRRKARYLGNFDVGSYGNFQTWRDMVVAEVIPYPTLQLVLVAALSAVVVGALSLEMPIENPIVHLNLPSGRGKSTAGYLATSTIGRPFDGTMTRSDDDGKIEKKHSLYQSWGATENAMIATHAGNQGAVVVLNELGKNLSKNMTHLIFNLSEGTDKKRLTSTLKQRNSDSYSTTFISTGESSLLAKCTAKLEGLAIRVMEITSPLTESAEHSNRIKNTCFDNGGFAAPKLARYILRNLSISRLKDYYLLQLEKLKNRFQSTQNKARFVEKFAALFVVTAAVSQRALGISFDIKGLIDYLDTYDLEHSAERNVAANSAADIIELCRVNANKFFVRANRKLENSFGREDYSSTPQNECWGRITHTCKKLADGRYVVQEFEIRKNVLEGLLDKLGYSNRSTCITAWRNDGILDFEDATHACRERKIDPTAPKGNSEKVYVLRCFATEAEAEGLRQDEEKRQKELAKKQAKKKINLLEGGD